MQELEKRINELQTQVNGWYSELPNSRGGKKRRLKTAIRKAEDQIKDLMKRIKNQTLADKGIDNTADITGAISNVAQSASNIAGSITGLSINRENNRTERERLDMQRDTRLGRQEMFQNLATNPNANQNVLKAINPIYWIIGLGLVVILIFKGKSK